MSKLSAKQVGRIKESVLKGRRIQTIADRYGVSYMAIYKIAKWRTWRKVTPRGNLFDRVSVFSNREKRFFALSKLKSGLSNRALRSGLQVEAPESTFSAAIREGRQLLAIDAHSLFLIHNSHVVACKKFGLEEDSVSELVLISSEGSVPDRVRTRHHEEKQQRRAD